MAEVVVIGAGLSGTLMAYELLPKLRKEDRLTVISQGPVYHFVPSNPWVAIGWRKRGDIEIDLVDIMKRKGIRLLTQGAQRVHPAENRIELADGSSIDYDYLVVATGPELAFDEIPGLGPDGHTQSICHVDHAAHAQEAFEKLAANPGPVVIGAVQGASCFGPAYEFLFILETELRRRKLRDRVPMTFVTSEPYIGHLGLDGVGDTKGLLESEMREKHIKWITNARVEKRRAGQDDRRGGRRRRLGSQEPRTAVRLFDDAAGVSRRRPPFAASRSSPTRAASSSSTSTSAIRHSRTCSRIGVCVAIAPVGATPVPVGVPKTGFMIESMVTATALNIGALLRGEKPTAQPTWNAICLADFGDSGVAFLAQPQIPPRNVNWSSKGEWVHYAKVAFEKYFLRKIRRGESEPFYERFLLDKLNIAKIKETEPTA